MRSMPSLVLAIFAVFITVSACSSGQSGPSGQTHAEAAHTPVPVPVSTPSGPSVAQQAQKVIEAQKQVLPLQTAGTFCMRGIIKDAQDQAVSEAIKEVDPTGGDAYTTFSLTGDYVTLYKQNNVFDGTFSLGQFLYHLIAASGEKGAEEAHDEPLAFQFWLFGLIGPAAIYCAEAAFWLDGTVGGQIGTALQKKFLAWSVGQQLLASRASAITGKWVLYRKEKQCSVTGSNNQGCLLSPMDVTIACSGSACTIVRTNASPGYQPWDHAIPITFGQGAWQASGTEKWAAMCNHAPVPGSSVVLTLKVTSGQVVKGVWRAQGLNGRYKVNNVATSCFSAGTSIEEVSTTPFTG